MVKKCSASGLSVGVYIRVTDAMWQMLQAQECVVLCTGLVGDPTAAEFGAAAAGGKLQAVLAQALFH
ncbi:hypothetical protein ACFV28_27410 [Streptomyces sp. NPDC059720]|uniref:hypothetical protein n=1 Tax=Streptomyces sp. NPDC059720 TaxID=3346924 RepID=UPI003690C795